MFRRDEIWLTELNASHASTLSTVLRSSPRKHEHIDIYSLPLKAAGNGNTRGDRVKFAT